MHHLDRRTITRTALFFSLESAFVAVPRAAQVAVVIYGAHVVYTYEDPWLGCWSRLPVTRNVGRWLSTEDAIMVIWSNAYEGRGYIRELIYTYSSFLYLFM